MNEKKIFIYQLNIIAQSVKLGEKWHKTHPDLVQAFMESFLALSYPILGAYSPEDFKEFMKTDADYEGFKKWWDHMGVNCEEDTDKEEA